MVRSKTLISFLPVLGIAMLCLFFTPFVDTRSGEIFHSRITFQGSLVVGRFLIYLTLLIAICIVVVAGRNRIKSRA